MKSASLFSHCLFIKRLGAAAALALLVNQATAATHTWDGSTSGNWATNTNWSGDVTPTFNNTADIIISGTGSIGVMFNGSTDRTLKSLTFDASNDGLTLFALSNSFTAGAVSRHLTFSADSGNAKLIVESGATGDKQILRTGTLFSNVNLTSSLDVIHNGSGTFIFGGQTIIQGAGGINKSGTGSLTLSGANTYLGATTITGGTLSLGHATNTLSSSSAVTVDGATAVLSIAGNSDTVGAVSLKNGGSITGTGGTLTGASYAVESGSVSAILGGAGIVLTKSTAGTVTITGANTYTGGTTVSAGTLEVNNTSGSGTGSGTVTVNGTLAGEGSITTGINNYVYLNGTLQVGSLGATQGTDFSLTTSGVGSTVLGGSSVTSFDIWSSTSGDQSGNLAAADMLRIFGDFSITGGSSLVLNNPNSRSFMAGDVFKLFDWAGLGTLTGTYGSIDSSSLGLGSLMLDTSNLYTTTGALAGTIGIIAIPEPSRALLMMLGLAGLVTRRRRC